MPPFYVVGARLRMPLGTQLLIPVELGDRSCPYKVKRRSGFQIFPNKGESAGILRILSIRDPIVVNTFVFTTYVLTDTWISPHKSSSLFISETSEFDCAKFNNSKFAGRQEVSNKKSY